MDNIFVHFPSTGEPSAKGACKSDNPRQIAARVSEYSMVSWMRPVQHQRGGGGVIARSALGLSSIGVRGIFSTYHDLARRVDELNRHSANKAKIDNLAEVEPDTTNRTFKILRAKPDGLLCPQYRRAVPDT